MWWIIALIIIVVLVIAIFGIAYYFFRFSIVRKGFGPPVFDAEKVWGDDAQLMLDCQKWIDDNATETLEITSFDGLKLKAIYVPSKLENPKGTMIVMHGYRSYANVDFAPEAEFLHDLGYRLILPHQRSHGYSEGKYITYGFNERYDCKGWADYAAGRFGRNENIFLAGISMGCATVVMASALELPENVRGIMADCGYTSPWDIMAHVAKRDYHMPPFPILYAANLISKLVAGFDFKAVSTIDALKKNKIPVLFIHGDKDDFVPTYMTNENYDVCVAEKEILIVKGAAHAQAFVTDVAACEDAIRKFVEKYERLNGK